MHARALSAVRGQSFFFLDIRNVPRVRPTSPNEATAEDTTREDLRSRSPSPELPAPEYPDTDPLPKLGNSKQPCSNSHQAPTPKRFYSSITSSITPQSDNFIPPNLIILVISTVIKGNLFSLVQSRREKT